MQRAPMHKIVTLLWLYYLKKKMVRMMKMKGTASHRGQTLAGTHKAYIHHGKILWLHVLSIVQPLNL